MRIHFNSTYYNFKLTSEKKLKKKYYIISLVFHNTLKTAYIINYKKHKIFV